MRNINFSIFNIIELEILRRTLYCDVEFAGYNAVKNDFKDEPLSWEEYVDSLIHCKGSLDILSNILKQAIQDYPIDEICFGKELELKSFIKSEHAPTDKKGVIHMAELFPFDEGASLIFLFLEKVKKAYYQQIYKTEHPEANEAMFLSALQTDPRTQLEIKKSLQIHISHIDFLSMF